MEIKRLDDANVEFKSEISNKEVEERINKLAKKMGKQIKVDGFRKGKVPVSIVKKLYGKDIKEDAIGELINELLNNAKKKAKIDDNDILGEPVFKKYEEGKDKIDTKVLICLKPKVNIEGYRDLIPAVETPKATDEEIEKQLQEFATQNSSSRDIKEDKNRELKSGDIAVIDFVGYLNGELFEGGEAYNYELKIGSNSFVGDFEEKLIGMKVGDERQITVFFPENYQAENLRGKYVQFDVALKKIKEEVPAKIDDDLAKKVLKKDDATVEDLKKEAEKRVVNQKLTELYEDKLKPEYLETLVKKFDFALPQNIVEQEIDNLANQKAQSLSKDELEKIQGSSEKIDELRESVRKDAENSVKATFIVDAIAKAENITVTDEEFNQIIYFEALVNGQDPQELMRYYEKNNLIPAIKMGIIEDKLFIKLFNLDKR